MGFLYISLVQLIASENDVGNTGGGKTHFKLRINLVTCFSLHITEILVSACSEKTGPRSQQPEHRLPEEALSGSHYHQRNSSGRREETGVPAETITDSYRPQTLHLYSQKLCFLNLHTHQLGEKPLPALNKITPVQPQSWVKVNQVKRSPRHCPKSATLGPICKITRGQPPTKRPLCKRPADAQHPCIYLELQSILRQKAFV